MSDIGLNIGHNFKDAGHRELAESIVLVATCSPFESVCEQAVEAFMKATQINNVSINGVNVNQKINNEWMDDGDD